MTTVTGENCNKKCIDGMWQCDWSSCERVTSADTPL